MVVVTAAGKKLGAERHDLRMRSRELAPVLEEYRALPDTERNPALVLGENVTPPKRPVPDPPKNGLIVRGYCTYLKRGDDGQIDRAKRFYYEQNPDRWAAETQSDMLWLTEAECKSLVPAEARVGQAIEVASAIQERFFTTIGIDYMEGSVNSLPARDTAMTLRVERADADGIEMRLDGYARLGKEFDGAPTRNRDSRGSEVRVLGYLHYDARRGAFDRFDLVGTGEVWGNKMDYTVREVRIPEYPWLYGIACELVPGDTPMEHIPPYNLLHYNSVGPYFGDH